MKIFNLKLKDPYKDDRWPKFVVIAESEHHARLAACRHVFFVTGGDISFNDFECNEIFDCSDSVVLQYG